MSIFLGTAWVFVSAVMIVLLWAAMGPVLGYSAGWQLAINTGTTIITFLMVFIIQNTQNRDNRAIHLKLDELLESVADAREDLVDIEHETEEQMEKHEKEFAERHQAAMAGR